MGAVPRYLLALTLLVSQIAGAVSVNPDGTGEALLYSYYTVRSAKGNPYNTLVSIVNHAADAKAVRVRFREGRNSREVASFNLFLGPNDVWAAAVIPTAAGARLISTDRSCVSPALESIPGEVPGLAFTSASYVGDGNGDELDRVREGWIEVVEMATLTGASATAVTHDKSLTPMPNNCAAVQGSAAPQTASPTGGLAGTLTLINVTSGLAFTAEAVALMDLASGSYYRPAHDSYPGFGAAEIRPVSVVTDGGFVYRSTWSRGVDAVSAVLMRSSWFGEFNLDAGTASSTDFVVTFPTRHHYVTGGLASSPFSANCQSLGGTWAGEPIEMQSFNREEFGGGPSGFDRFPPAANFRCGASTVIDFHNYSSHTNFTPETQVLGSSNRGLPEAGMAWVASSPNGWAGFTATGGKTLTSLISLDSSLRVDVASGTLTSGAHQFSGLPVIGLGVRTFVNATLTCGAGLCQGNFGSALPLRFRRTISLKVPAK